MAISQSQIVLKHNGQPVVDGQLNNILPNGYIGDGNAYTLVEVWNTNPSLTLSTVKAWLYVDPSGGTFAIALAQSTAIATSATFGFDSSQYASLTYSSPTAQGSGLSLPDLAANTKALVAVRRNLASASAAYPERNRIYVGGSSPI